MRLHAGTEMLRHYHVFAALALAASFILPAIREAGKKKDEGEFEYMLGLAWARTRLRLTLIGIPEVDLEGYALEEDLRDAVRCALRSFGFRTPALDELLARLEQEAAEASAACHAIRRPSWPRAQRDTAMAVFDWTTGLVWDEAGSYCAFSEPEEPPDQVAAASEGGRRSKKGITPEVDPSDKSNQVPEGQRSATGERSKGAELSAATTSESCRKYWLGKLEKGI